MSYTGLKLGEEPYIRGSLAAWELGSSRNHLSTFLTFKLFYYQSKFFIYYVTGHKDYSVFHELCDLYCLIGVRVLSYRSSELELESDRLAN